MRYPFPGNIRQLKNIAEQVSLLEEHREVNAATLSKYLPQESSRLPMTLPGQHFGGDNSDFSERDILYKVLFDMKKDMNELKKLVLESFQSGGLNASLIQKHQGLFEEVEGNFSPKNLPNPAILIKFPWFWMLRKNPSVKMSHTKKTKSSRISSTKRTTIRFRSSEKKKK